MKKNIVWLLMLGLAALAPAAWAQDAEDPKDKDEAKARAHKPRVVVVEEHNHDQDPEDGGDDEGSGRKVRGAAQVQVEDGKLVVIDHEGNRQEFDISGAKGLTISSSTTQENEDGEQTTKSVGKAIIVGPDGEKTEIQFDGVIDMDDLPQFQLRRGPVQGRVRMIPAPAMPLQGLAEGGQLGVLNLDTPVGKYFIGVMCEAIDEETADELDLDEPSGLIVREVSEDSPAAEAGVEAEDVLLLADDTELAEATDLVEVVQKAGEEGNELTLTLIRDGDEEQIRVRPAERDMEELSRMQFEFQPNAEGGAELHVLPDMQGLRAQLGELQQLGPALMLEAQGLANNPELKAELEEAMREMRDELQRAAAEMRDELQQASEELRAQMDEFRSHVEEAREQLSRQKEELDRLRESRPRRGGDRDDGSEGDGNAPKA